MKETWIFKIFKKNQKGPGQGLNTLQTKSIKRSLKKLENIERKIQASAQKVAKKEIKDKERFLKKELKRKKKEFLEQKRKQITLPKNDETIYLPLLTDTYSINLTQKEYHECAPTTVVENLNLKSKIVVDSDTPPPIPFDALKPEDKKEIISSRIIRGLSSEV